MPVTQVVRVQPRVGALVAPSSRPRAFSVVQPSVDDRALAALRDVWDVLTPAERTEALALTKASLEGLPAPLTYMQFVERVNPRFRWNEHNVRVAGVLQRVADGELKRVMIFEPPRHGKSEQVTRLFPAYYLYRHGERWVAVAAFSQGLANGFSRAARGYYHRQMDEADDVAATVQQWETGHGGGMWAAGLGGEATGKGFHLGIVDDPVKDEVQASSETTQQRHQDWWDSVWTTRMEPDAALLITLTRWNERDLAGWLLEREADEPEAWHIVHLPAIAEAFPPIANDGSPLYPDTCTLEPDWRCEGEPLAPARYPLAVLEKKRRGMVAYFWNALYQQRPAPRAGNLFQREWFPIVSSIRGRVVARARWWDFGATEGAGDATSGGLVAKVVRDGVERYVIEHLNAFRHSPGKRDTKIKAQTRADMDLVPRPIIYGEQEPGASGKGAAIQFRQNLAGAPVATETSDSGKIVAFLAFASVAELGLVEILDSNEHIAAFLKEATDAPFGRHDDILESVCKAFLKVAPMSSASASDYHTTRA